MENTRGEMDGVFGAEAASAPAPAPASRAADPRMSGLIEEKVEVWLF